MRPEVMMAQAAADSFNPAERTIAINVEGLGYRLDTSHNY
jgi:hypothetical protein